MIQNTFTHRGEDVNVFLDEVTRKDHYFQKVINGNVHEYGIKTLEIDAKAESILIRYYWLVKDSGGNIITSNDGKFQGSDNGEYALFYDKDTVGVSLGIDFFKAALNGLMQGFLAGGAFCYNPFDNYSFFQPLTFDLVPTIPTEGNADGEINVQVVDGGAGKTIRYSIDGGSFGSNNTFTGLATGVYKIGVKTTEDGVPFFKTIQI